MEAGATNLAAGVIPTTNHKAGQFKIKALQNTQSGKVHVSDPEAAAMVVTAKSKRINIPLTAGIEARITEGKQENIKNKQVLYVVLLRKASLPV